MQRVSVKDVAQAAGVATGTVSNYLNHPERLSPRLASRVRVAIDALGFVPSVAGRDLRMGGSGVIGYLTPGMLNPFAAHVAQGVEERAAELGATVFFAMNGPSLEREQLYLDLFEQHRVRGLVVASNHPIEERLARIRARGIPSVLVAEKANSLDQLSVSIDDADGGRQVAAHLVDQGCRRIAFVGGPLALPQVAQRLSGAGSLLRERSVDLMVIDTEERTIDEGHGVGLELARRAPRDRPDGVFAANDLLALGIIQALAAEGIAVPADVRVVGYDDTEFARASLVPLTSVGNRHDRLGAEVVDVLLRAIAGGPIDEPHLVLAPELIPRASSVA